MLVHAIIPARKGSKGVKNKNLLPVKGVPLFQRSINHAISLNDFHQTKIWVTTNINEILSLPNKDKNINFHRRPENLSGDDILTIEVVLDVINTYDIGKDDIIILLQPTSPFRCIDEISNSIEIIKKENEWQSVVSLSEVGGNHPFRMKRLTSNGECINFIDQGFEDMRPRQSLSKVYIRSGNFYITTVQNILQNRSLINKPCKGVIHTKNHLGINIDNYLDLEIANKYEF